MRHLQMISIIFTLIPLVSAVVRDPVWPNDFKWSSSGIPGGYDCLQITEPSDPDSWHDNYFCWKQGTKNPGMQWSNSVRISDVRCTQINEASEPDSHSWDDNYLCVPNSSNLFLSWSMDEPIPNQSCIQWKETQSWHDNYLCAKEMKEVEYSTKWRLWAHEKNKKNPIWDVIEISLYASRDCTGQRITDGTVISSAYHGCCPPANAFDSNHGTIWGGRPDGEDQVWIGKEFDNEVQIGCVEFQQKTGGHGARDVIVQAWTGDQVYENVAAISNIKYQSVNYIATISHRVTWKASIRGKVTTKPNAGSLPIKEVKITYQLGEQPANDTDDDLNFIPIQCDGCSGTEYTNESGEFDFAFNIDHEKLDSNEKEFPVLIKFSKKTGDTSHKFLCNDGEDDCSDELGTIVYLKHLQFQEPLHIYDGPAVIYRIANADITTERPSVEEFYMKDIDGNEIKNELICSGSAAVEKGCQNAVDKVSPWWRPQCDFCSVNEAWIGYKVRATVKLGSAFVSGLGIGSGDGTSFSESVVLQMSKDGGTSWEQIGSATNSDTVAALYPGPAVRDPIWPNDFKWSSSGIPIGYDCIQIDEPYDPDSWHDNYFCWKQGTKNPGMQWSNTGSISHLRCRQIYESIEPDSHSWDDNYLCVPNSSNLFLSWSTKHPIPNQSCIQWKAKQSWHDNYLCAKEMKEVEYSTKWRLWAHEKNKKNPVWDVQEISFYASRDCTGQRITDGTVISSAYHGCCPPANAFDSNHGTIWGGRPDGEDQVWIGKEFDNEVQIGCVEFQQKTGGHGARDVIVQAWTGDQVYENVAAISNIKYKTVNYIGLTRCSCDSSRGDTTGKPTDLEVRQEHGEIMFDFHDNSKCEEYFSFERRNEDSNEEINFTNDYHFIGHSDCSNEKISPGLDASDSLNLSKLRVGSTHVYSLRASARKYNVGTRTSDPATLSHTVTWEASIRGKVTTEPNAGSLPIKEVKITYQLGNQPANDTDDDLNFIPLQCDGCSGTEYTNEGGGFNFAFNIDHKKLHDNNEKEFPVHIKFSKTTGNMTHDFLCNDGEDDCSKDLGTIVYLKHLQFQEPLHVYDDTSVPFSGKVFIHDTVYQGSDGCPIANARIELIQKKKMMTEIQEEILVSGLTHHDGSFDLPVILGSTVDRVKIEYYGHEFLPSPGGNYIAGQTIKEGKYYGNNDFIDISKAHLFVEVVGGLCDEDIGTSIIQINILGCDWNPFKTSDKTSDTKTMTGTRQVFNNLPAHQLEIQVMDIIDEQDSRHNDIFDHFQGSQPETRFIDLTESVAVDNAVAKEKNAINSNEGKKGTENNNYIEQEKEDEAAMEKEEEEETDTVRFQYDGVLKMEVTVPDDQLKCSSYSLLTYNMADTLHVVEYMERYEPIRVDLKYEIIKNQVYCDIVEEGLKVVVDNQIGIDGQDGFQTFYEEIVDDETRDLLKYCSNTSCSIDVEHKTNGEGNPVGGAGINFGPFAPGRPNKIDPYSRNIIFTVNGGTQALQHKAAFFIQGYFSEGVVGTLALPTHKPVMILRDPPGGMSYATYDNIKTTFKIETSHTSVHMSHGFGMGIKKQLGMKLTVSTGLGGGILGAIFETNNDALEVESNLNAFNFGIQNGGVVHQDYEEQSNQFSTIWSYKTSEDPWLAGPMSDIFVVPNLNVRYERVLEVRWNNNICGAVTDDNLDPPLPTKVLFDIDAASTKAAMSFYSRYHVETVKLPELKSTLEVKRSNKNACKNGFDSTGCPFTVDEKNEIKLLDEEIALLETDTIPAWEEVLKVEEDEKQQTSTSILNWFERVVDQSELNAEVRIKEHPSSITPPAITNKATMLTDRSYEDKIKDPTKIERIQFSGGGDTMAMQMNYEEMSKHLTNSCWKGCNVDSKVKIGLPSLDSFETKAFENGLKMYMDVGDITIKTTHTSTKSSQEADSTSVGFVLGDQDPQDEFVIDIFADEKYGTLIFKTEGGRSKCPHELGTLAVEDPRMEISKYPSQFVFPDDKMIFELELSNMGVGEESLFVLYAQHRDNRDGLDFKLDGAPFVSSREFTNIKKNVLYRKTLTIAKGSRLYRNEPIDLVFESACEDSNSLVNDLTASSFSESKSVTRKLFNIEGDNGNKYLEFVEPCPKVQWAGEINRDNGFVVNTNSDQKHLLVTVFNPNRSEKTFRDMTANRLEHVYLKYRKMGDIAWRKGQIKVYNTETNYDDSHDLDFASKYGNEDDYGYISMKWSIDSVKQGTYEVKVGTQCNKLSGPDHIDRFDAPIMEGVIDFTRPEQYGKPIPLRDEILIGEEMSVIFTEPLQCEEPLSFDMLLTIDDTTYKFEKEELHVVCEGRNIAFQIDLKRAKPEEIMGKEFTVEIGRIGANSKSNIMDRNGNAINPNVGNVKFTKKFASLELDEVVTSFIFSLESVCYDATIGSLVDEIKNHIATLLELPDTSRIALDDIHCVEGSKVTAEVKLNPSSKRGRLLRVSGGESGDDYHSLDLFYKLCNVSEANKVSRKRKLGSISDWLGDDDFIEDGSPSEPSSLSGAVITKERNQEMNVIDNPLYKDPWVDNRLYEDPFKDLSNDEMDSVDRKESEDEDDDSRLLHQMIFHLSDMKILPCATDMERLKTNSDAIEEEEHLLYVASLDDHEALVSNDVLVEDLKVDIHQVRILEEEVRKDNRKMMEEIRRLHEHEEQREKEMNEQREKEMKGLQMEYAFVTLACMSVSLVLYFHLKKR